MSPQLERLTWSAIITLCNRTQLQSRVTRLDSIRLPFQLPHWHIALVYPTIIRIGRKGSVPGRLAKAPHLFMRGGQFQASMEHSKPGCRRRMAAELFASVPIASPECHPKGVRQANSSKHSMFPHTRCYIDATLFRPLPPQILDQPESC